MLNHAAIYRVPSSGGSPEPATTLDTARPEGSHYFPSFLPDGDHFLYGVKSSNAANGGIFVASLKDPRVKVKVAAAFSNATFVPPAPGRTGYLLYCGDGKLLAQPFDASTLRSTGDASVLGEPGLLPNQSMANFASAGDGTVVIGSAGEPKVQMAWLDVSGNRISVIGSPDYFEGPRISPDGLRVTQMRYAFAGTGGVVVVDLVRGITLDLGSLGYPCWSPDGKGLIYFRAGKIMRKDPDSAAPPTALADIEGPVLSHGDISPDGNYVAVRNVRGLVAVALGQKDHQPILFGDGASPRFSPDGRYIAYSGISKPGIYVEKFPERTFRTVVANAGSAAVWARDGKQLYYRSPQGRLVSVDISDSANGMRIGSAHELSLSVGSAITSYDVSPDGKRFLSLVPEEKDRAENELTILLNWRETLKR